MEMNPLSSTSAADRIFPLLLLVTLLLFTAIGLRFRTVAPKAPEHSIAPEGIKTEFLLEEPRPKIIEEEKTEKTAEGKKAPAEPIDLTEKVVTRDQEVTSAEDSKSEEKVRAVYGLRKVYSKGIGSGGSSSDAIIGRLGNTLDKDADTISVTADDLKGQVVSAATVTTPPKVKRRATPEYTKEMLQNRVEGTIRVRTLVDTDGRVKSAELLNDLGFGSGEQALQAVKSILFSPALRDDEPVAVWIVVPVRFVLLS